jgi:hypothetical protein
VTDGAPLAEVGGAGAGGRDGRDRPREALAEKLGAPLFASLASDASALPDVRASALIALAKVANDTAARKVLRDVLHDARAPDMVRESAALAHGLLRRSSAEQRLAPGELGDVRQALLAVVDDVRAPERTRAFAAFALGLLGDQGFTLAAEQEGRVLALALWSRLGRLESSSELPVALLTALGMQSSADVPNEVRDGLRGLVVGQKVLGYRWSDMERSHGLTALCRLWPGGSFRDVVRELSRARAPVEIVRAGAIAAGSNAAHWADESRAEAAGVLRRALGAAKDPWTRGLIRISLGRILAADMDAHASGFSVTETVRLLAADARRVIDDERGYAVLALAIAARPVARGAEGPAWAREAEALALEGVARPAEDDGVRAAYAVALGLLGAPAAAPVLETHLAERGLGPRTRSAGAVALGQIGLRTPEVVRALILTLMDRRQYDLRGDAALALSWLGTREALPLLLREAEDARAPERVLAEVAVALGRLGHLGAVDTLAAIAKDRRRGEASRALAVVALGLVLDPEPRPSLLRITAGANYPARTAALHEVLTIL